MGIERQLRRFGWDWKRTELRFVYDHRGSSTVERIGSLSEMQGLWKLLK
jgi:hypothetical protein